MTDVRRRLAAIVAADVAGYSRLMGADEEGTIASLRAHRREVIEPKLSEYHGRIANTAGDSFLIEFASAVDALRCAIEIQSAISDRNADVPEDRRLVLRIGINVGDVVSQGEDLLGDGVNVAARLEGLADPGGICISRSARDQVRDRLDIELEDLGEIEVKNIARPVRAFRVVKGGKSPNRRTRRAASKSRYILGAVALLALIAGGGLWWRNSSSIVPEAPVETADNASKRPSIAVLPFANLSDQKEQAYFADGITEDITTDLSRVAGIYVTSRSATLRFRGNTHDPRRIGIELGVGHILEGSVRRAGGKIRVTAKLIDARTGGQLWAERYDRETQGVFAVQDEIAVRVVEQLSRTFGIGSLSPAKRAYTPKVEAYDLYIQGRVKRIPPTPPNLSAALGMFNKAIEIDPKFAGGYAGASFAHVLLYADSTALADFPGDHLETAERLARKAVELDPDFGPAWGSLAEVYFRKGKFEEAIRAIEKAMKAAPSDSLMRANYGRLLGHVGRAEKGIEQIRLAIRMSPDSLPLLYFLGANFRVAGQFDKAIEALTEHRKRLGGRILPGPTSQLIAAFSGAGREIEARKEAQKLLKRVPHYTVKQASRTHVYQSSGDRNRFAAALREAGVPE